LFGCCLYDSQHCTILKNKAYTLCLTEGLLCFLLQLVWEHLYKIESGRDVGTLYYFRNLFGRNNAKQKVKYGFGPAEDLFLQVFNAYVVAAFMDWTGMMEIQSPPNKVSAPPDVMRNQ